MAITVKKTKLWYACELARMFNKRLDYLDPDYMNMIKVPTWKDYQGNSYDNLAIDNLYNIENLNMSAEYQKMTVVPTITMNMLSSFDGKMDIVATSDILSNWTSDEYSAVSECDLEYKTYFINYGGLYSENNYVRRDYYITFKNTSSSAKTITCLKFFKYVYYCDTLVDVYVDPPSTGSNPQYKRGYWIGEFIKSDLTRDNDITGNKHRDDWISSKKGLYACIYLDSAITIPANSEKQYKLSITPDDIYSYSQYVKKMHGWYAMEACRLANCYPVHVPDSSNYKNTTIHYGYTETWLDIVGKTGGQDYIQSQSYPISLEHCYNMYCPGYESYYLNYEKYILNDSSTWDPNKKYWEKDGNIYHLLLEKPDDWDINWNTYYIHTDGYRLIHKNLLYSEYPDRLNYNIRGFLDNLWEYRPVYRSVDKFASDYNEDYSEKYIEIGQAIYARYNGSSESDTHDSSSDNRRYLWRVFNKYACIASIIPYSYTSFLVNKTVVLASDDDLSNHTQNLPLILDNIMNISYVAPEYNENPIKPGLDNVSTDYIIDNGVVKGIQVKINLFNGYYKNGYTVKCLQFMKPDLTARNDALDQWNGEYYIPYIFYYLPTPVFIPHNEARVITVNITPEDITVV